jgi:hypothetical protein
MERELPARGNQQLPINGMAMFFCATLAFAFCLLAIG